MSIGRPWWHPSTSGTGHETARRRPPSASGGPRRLPDAQLHVFPGEGHLIALTRWSAILTALAG